MNKEEIKALIEYINPKEIASQIEAYTLAEWGEKIKREMLYNLNEMRSSLNFLYGGTVEEPRIGRWRAHREISREYNKDVIVSIIYDYWFCDCCGYKVYDCGQPMYNYCPNCGAKMGEEINE